MSLVHQIQRNLLSLIRREDITDLSYRQIAERIKCDHASQVKHHLEQLIKKGLVIRNSTGNHIATGELAAHESNLLNIPVLGEADCGEATRLANDEVIGQLSVSPNALLTRSLKDIFALKARGSSMNRCAIYSKSIDDGDYVLVKKCSPSEVTSGDYIVSLIQGFANIKRVEFDYTHHRILLKSESFDEHPPIVIAEADREYYHLIGKVVEVVKM